MKYLKFIFSIIFLIMMAFILILKKDIETFEGRVKELTEVKIVEKTKESESSKKVVQVEEKGLKVLSVTSESGETSIVEISLSEELESRKDIKAYVKFENLDKDEEINYEVLHLSNKIVLNGKFNLDCSYELTLLEGLKSKNDKVLEKNYNRKVNFREMKPKLEFSSDGIILPSINNKKIAFRSINVRKVNLEIRRVFENNTTQFLQDYTFKGNGSLKSYNSQEVLERVGKVVLKGEYDLDYVKNNWIQTEINLEGSVEQKGIYLVKLFYEEEDMDYEFPPQTKSWEKYSYLDENSEISKGLITSDIGMSLIKSKEGYILSLKNILSNFPIKEAEITAMSYNNQVIFQGTTSISGEVIFNAVEDIFYIIARNKEEISILKLKDNLLSYDGFLVGGNISEEGLRTFIYSDRGVYRPGDKINLSIIARNEKKSFPKDHPININIYSPSGKLYIENRVLTNGKNGFYTYSFETEPSSETGLWTGEVIVGNKTYKIGLPIETIIPNTISVEVKSQSKIDINKGKVIDVDLRSSYLFGGKASSLKYETEINYTENPPYFEKYKNYSFYNPGDYEFTYSDSKKGSLNEEGKAKLKFDILKVTPKNINLKGEIKTRIIENSGRPVKKTNYIELEKFSSFVGIEKPESNYIKSEESINLNVIVVSNDGETLIPNKKMKYRIYKNEYSWWWDYGSHSSFIKSIKTDVNTKLIHEGEFTSKEEPTLIDYKIQGEGEVFVEVIDTETNQSSGVNFYVDTWGNSETNKKVDKLKIETDKKSYGLGERVVITYEGSKKSLAEIIISKEGKIIKRFTKEIDNLKNKEELIVTKAMFPTSYVNINLYQNYEDLENNRPLRLYGAVPLNIIDKSSELEIGIDTPLKVKPQEEVSIKISNEENIKMDYTVAIVDEGLLNLTDFKTPSPWEYFYGKQGLQLKIYDNYNEVMGRITGEINQVLETGGGFGESNLMSKSFNMQEYREKEIANEKAERFKPVAIFRGVLTTDEEGRGEVKFTMPNYMGRVRIMVVGASEEKYGRAEKDIIVTAPIVPLMSLPRNLKIGDEIEAAVEVFGEEEGLGEINLRLDFNNKTLTKTINLSKGEKKEVIFKLKSPEEIGKLPIKLSLESSKYNYQEEVEIDVVSNSSYIYLNKLNIIKKDGSKTYRLPEKAIKAKGEIVVSASPILGLDKRLESLITYPYGCVEQITSRLFASLYIKELGSESRFDQDEITRNINGEIGRLLSYQLYNGGLAYWPRSTKENLWASIYVGDFLAEAKSKGYYVPPDLYESLKDFILKEIIKKDTNLNLKVYALYVLAKSQELEVSETNLIYENHMDKLNLTSKWRLASLYKTMGNEEVARKIADSLSRDYKTETMKKRRDFYKLSFGSSLKDKSIILNSYYEIYEEVDESLYKEILNELQGEAWLSTQSTGAALMSISKIKKENSSKGVVGSYKVNGEVKEFSTENQDFILVLDEDIKDVEIINKGSEEIFTYLYWEGLPLNYQGENISKNLELARKYYNTKGEVIDINALESGQSFWMEIEVKGNEGASYFYVDNLALTQILPTGWEIENLRLKNEKPPKWIKSQGRYDYEDIRDDRVMWFFSYENYKGRSKKFYIKINTVTKGKFRLPGTKVEGMYNNNYEAYLKGYEVEVN